MKTFRQGASLWILLVMMSGGAFAKVEEGAPTCARQGETPSSTLPCCSGLHAEAGDADDPVTTCEGAASSGGGTNTITDSAPVSPPSSSSETPIQYGLNIQCLRDDGTVAGLVEGQKTCDAVLMKCSDVRKSMEKNLRKDLSMKIWGYYNHLDVDPESTRDALKPLPGSKPITSGVCSVVGHKIRWTGCSGANCDVRHNPEKFPDFEVRKVVGGQWQALQYYGGTGVDRNCGTHPTMYDGGSKHVKIVFNESSGKLWQSYVMGIYPWLLRRHAHKVLTELKPDLSNYDKVIGNVKLDSMMVGGMSAKAFLLKTQKIVTESYEAFSVERKQMCTTQKGTDLITRCKDGKISINEPANALCTLASGYAMYQEGAIPNFLLAEVLARADHDYQEIAADLFGGGANFNLFERACSMTTDNGAAVKPYVAQASCITDGINFYGYKSDNRLGDSHGDGKKRRRATRTIWFKINQDSPTVSQIDFRDEGENTRRSNLGVNYTLNRGFAGLVEWYIRRKVCEQTTINSPSFCDSINIPTDPKDLEKADQ